jgi:hypothetical protein
MHLIGSSQPTRCDFGVTLVVSKYAALSQGTFPRNYKLPLAPASLP